MKAALADAVRCAVSQVIDLLMEMRSGYLALSTAFTAPFPRIHVPFFFSMYRGASQVPQKLAAEYSHAQSPNANNNQKLVLHGEPVFR